MTVTITFRTPSRKRGNRSSRIHERTLEAVPRAEAEQMVEDFVQYRAGKSEGEKSKLYQYTEGGSDVFVALDFEEVIALTASEI